jgi:hypothetical protein
MANRLAWFESHLAITFERATIGGDHGRPGERRMEGRREVVELARVTMALRGAASSR